MVYPCQPAACSQTKPTGPVWWLPCWWCYRVHIHMHKQLSVCFHWESFDLLKEPLLWKPNEKIIEWNLFAFHPFLTLVPARSEPCRPPFSSGSCKFDKNTKDPFSSLCQLQLDKLPCIQSGAFTSLSVFHTNYVSGPFLMHTDNQMVLQQSQHGLLHWFVHRSEYA